MSRSILEVETPSKCKECALYVCYRTYASDPGDEFCGVTKEDVVGYKRPDWCPLIDKGTE